MKPQQTIEAFDQFLFKKEKSFSAVIIGGGALAIMGVISRETQDVDVLEPALPADIINLSQEFAASYPQAALKKNWLNNGPQSLQQDLPSGWMQRTTVIFSGKALHLSTLGRSDFLKAKLFAFCDREQDRQDCILMQPTKEDLQETFIWLQQRDQSPQWPNHVKLSLQSLAKDLGYEF